MRLKGFWRKVADFVSMCRPLLADPYMPCSMPWAEEDHRLPPLQYCGARLLVPAVINCAVNPYLGDEVEFQPQFKVKKRVACRRWTCRH